MTTYKKFDWGIAIYRNRQQVGAAVGVGINVAMGREFESKAEARLWAKRGVVIVPDNNQQLSI